MSLSIGWITFVLSPWIMFFTRWVCHAYPLGLSFFFLGLTRPFTLLSLTRCFGICPLIIFLHCTPITGSVPYFLLDPWFNFRLDAHIFITERWKARFYIHTFFSRELPWPPYHFFSYRARVESFCGPRISIYLNAFPTRWRARFLFYLKNWFLLIKKMTWSRHLFLFYF